MNKISIKQKRMIENYVDDLCHLHLCIGLRKGVFGDNSPCDNKLDLLYSRLNDVYREFHKYLRSL